MKIDVASVVAAVKSSTVMEMQGEMGNVVFEGLVFSQGHSPCVLLEVETVRSQYIHTWFKPLFCY